VSSGSRELVINASAGDVWREIASDRLHDWYFRLAPERPLAEGAHVRLLNERGEAAEECDVVELVPAERLELRTRFLFAPNFIAEPPHTMRWEIAKSGSGSRVRLSWDAGTPVHSLFEAEAENILRALRRAVDPTERAANRRLDRIGVIEVRDVTPDRVGDYQAFFDHDAFRDYPAWSSCYCMETHRVPSDQDKDKIYSAAENRRDMSQLIVNRKVTALLAYVDGKPAGWCNYGETTRLGGVMHRFDLKPADYDGVGSIGCFVIAAPYRGHGVATRLLDVALERLRARGVKIVEAYPVKELESAQSNYRGPLSMYLRAGFEAHREKGAHQIVRKTL
jgi:GNAT superfamily N-acetyltransferase